MWSVKSAGRGQGVIAKYSEVPVRSIHFSLFKCYRKQCQALPINAPGCGFPEIGTHKKPCDAGQHADFKYLQQLWMLTQAAHWLQLLENTPWAASTMVQDDGLHWRQETPSIMTRWMPPRPEHTYPAAGASVTATVIEHELRPSDQWAKTLLWDLSTKKTSYILNIF